MIYVECLPDETLVTGLGVSQEWVEHHHGKSDICQRLQKQRGAKGLVDEDPLARRQHPYLVRLSEIQSSHNFRVLFDSSSGNTLIVLSPRLEDWVVGIARKEKVSLESFDLPDDPINLHKIVKQRIGKFQKLVHALRRTSAMSELERLLKS